MPRKYKRKEGVVPRYVTWTEDDMRLAFEEIRKGDKGINEIARSYGIPDRTLRRRFTKNNTEKQTLGKHPLLGFENEKRLVNHILKLGEAGFPPDRKAIRLLAYNFAENLGLKHNFDKETEMAGDAWFNSFIERNPELSIRQAEGLSLARAKGLSRVEVDNFFTLLIKTLTDNDLLDKPERIFNMDESGVQLNNKPGKVVAKKGARAVKTVTSGEKGETVTVVACCNAIGNFIPPVLILKGVNKKPEFEEGLPPGSKVYMSKKSAYVNTELFYKWLTEHFIPNKPQGKVLLILDGHTSHSSAVNMLETARENEVILLCLPSHTTSALQPLDRAVFGPFKTFFNAETNNFMRTNSTKKLSRYNSGKLIANAWIRATTPANAISGFRGSGIFPPNPNALPDSEFAISDIAMGNQEPARAEIEQPQSPLDMAMSDQAPAEAEQLQSPPDMAMSDQVPAEAEQLQSSLDMAMTDQVPAEAEIEQRTQPADMVIGDQAPAEIEQQHADITMKDQEPAEAEIMREQQLTVSDQQIESKKREKRNLKQNETLEENQRQTPSFLDISCLDEIDANIERYILEGTDPSLPSLLSPESSKPKETPSKFLHQSSPIPKIPLTMSKRMKQSAEILNSVENITAKKNAIKRKTKNTKGTENKKYSKPGTSGIDIKTVKNKKDTQLRKKKYSSSESDDYESIFRYEKLVTKTKQRDNSPKSDTENKESTTYKGKGKSTKGLPIKRRKEEKPVDETKNDSIKNFCVECFENYNVTKSKSDWIACIVCQQWLHESCTKFKIYCTRCGNLKKLTS